MRYAITYYKENIAGKNIADRFRELAFSPQIPIIELKKETLYSDLSVKKYPELRNIDFLVFASTHRSEKGNPSLSIHTPGNWRSADLGGEPGKVCMTSAFVIKYLFQELEKNAKNNSDVYEKYEITMEATHHGPLTNIPCCFVELGSQEKDWRDEKSAMILAKTIFSLDGYKPNYDWIPVIGIGGPHYTPNFNPIQLNSRYAIGHIIPEYSLPLTESIIKEAETKTKEQIKLALIDWKGCGKSEQRQEALGLLTKLGLKYERTKLIKKEE